ncbi:MAG: beta-lactamase family protein, partial [Gemmatimonadetes bacterium]|nr:beta-lactamase family protein [Gemmatimonadota bacterium]
MLTLSFGRFRRLLPIVLALSMFPAVDDTYGQTPEVVQTTVTPDATFEAIRAEILQRVESGEFPSMAVAVSHRDEIIWEEAFGWADRESEASATPTTVYPIGSLSKSITATGIMILVERGVIGLDDPVASFLPEGSLTVYEGEREAVTIRQVLHMRGGIPHGWATYGNVFDPPGIHEYLADAGVVVFPPGAEELYSNNAYGVLEAVISGATGRDFDEFIESEVFGPLGMQSSKAGLEPELVGVAASRYGEDQARLPYDQYEFVPTGGAGMYASVHDLIRYGMFHLKHPAPGQDPVLSDQNLDQMHFAKDPEHLDGLMAMGWGSVELNSGRRWLITNGSIGGANSMLTLLPNEELAVAVLTNISSSSLADETAIRIADLVSAGFAAEVGEAIGAYEEARAPHPFKPSASVVGEWRGALMNRGNEVPIAMSVHGDGSVTLKLADQAEIRIDEMKTREKQIRGSFRGRIADHPYFGRDHDMNVTLWHDDGRLYGVVTSEAETE